MRIAYKHLKALVTILHLVAHTAYTISYIGIIFLYSSHSSLKIIALHALLSHTHPVRTKAIETSLIIYTTELVYKI